VVSAVYENYTARETFSSYGLDLELPELQLRKTIKSRDFYLLAGKIEDTLRSWAQKYQRHADRLHKERRSESVDELNRGAAHALEELTSILAHTLDVDDTVDWNAIRRKDAYRVAPGELFEDGRAPPYLEFNNHGRPTGFRQVDNPQEPALQSVRREYGLFSKIFRSAAIRREFERRRLVWQADVEAARTENEQRSCSLDAACSDFHRRKLDFEDEKKRENDALEKLQAHYIEKQPQAIEEYCDLVLNASVYPDSFPQNWQREWVLITYSLVAMRLTMTKPA